MNREPYIKIYKVNRGWYAEVGCQSIIFGNTDKELEEMVQAFKTLVTVGESAVQRIYCDNNKYPDAPAAPASQEYAGTPTLRGLVETEPGGY